MTKRDKRLKKMRQNPKNVSFEDLSLVLEDFGFELMRSSGSHHSFSVMIDGEARLFVLPYQQPIKTVYVKEALKLIDKLIAEQMTESLESDSDEEVNQDED